MENIVFEIKEKEKNTDSILYKVTIKVPKSLGFIDDMKIIVDGNNYILEYESSEDEYSLFSGEIELFSKAIYHYWFNFYLDGKNVNYGDKHFNLSVNYSVPDWAKGKIMYHIFVDRFNKGNNSCMSEMSHRVIHKSWDDDIIIGGDMDGRWNTDFYGGNLQGIIEKLDYIKSLGVGIIYLSPIVLSQSNHRYDTADYENVDPYVGCNDDLRRLCDEAHKRDMKVIIDAVFNHTGNDSRYFNEFGTFNELGAFQSKDSKYYSFYKKHIVGDKTYFDYWWGMGNLPVCDGNSIEWQNYIYGVDGIIDKWFSYGIDGLRLDVADELSDSFIEGIRKAVKRNKSDGFILGEVWKNPMRMNRGYIISGKGMDSVMNYQLSNALIRYFKYGDFYKLSDVINQMAYEYPKDTMNSLMNFTSTHDISRAINIFGSNDFNPNGEWAWTIDGNDLEWQKNYKLSKEQYENGKKIYKSYLYSLAFLPGNLSIFYGDEIGMHGMGNLANRRPFTWDNIDYDILDFVRNIGNIRKNELFLENALLDLIYIDDKYYVFKRTGLKEEMLVFINRTNNKVDIMIPNEFSNEDIMYRLNDSSKKSLDKNGAIVLKRIKK